MKRVVIETKDGMRRIIGTTETQPEDMVDFGNGNLFGLVSLQHRRYYLYKPIISPSEAMTLFHGSQR